MADINRSQDLLMSLPIAHRHQVENSVIRTEKLIGLMGDLGLSSGAAQVAISRLTRAGVGRRIAVAGQRCMELTPYAQEIVAGVTERLQQFGRTPPSQDTFTIVWHSLPNESRAERSRLAQNLRLLGFGLLEDSTWIALTDHRAVAADLVERLGLIEYCSIMGGPTDQWTRPMLLVPRVWDLGALRIRYEEFLQRYTNDDYDSMSPRDAFVTRIRLLEDFKVFPTLDPEVTDVMGGLETLRSESIRTFDRIYDGLRSAAEEHFDRR